jgi:hypothetical protein
MIYRKISRTFFLGLVLSLILAYQNLQTQDLKVIHLNETLLIDEGTTGWLKENSIIEILDDADEIRISIEVSLDSGWISVKHDEGWVVETDSVNEFESFYYNSSQDSLFAELSNKILAFKAEMVPDEFGITSKNATVLIKMREKFKFEPYDLSLVTLIFKFGRLGYRSLDPIVKEFRILKRR